MTDQIVVQVNRPSLPTASAISKYGFQIGQVGDNISKVVAIADDIASNNYVGIIGEDFLTTEYVTTLGANYSKLNSIHGNLTELLAVENALPNITVVAADLLGDDHLGEFASRALQVDAIADEIADGSWDAVYGGLSNIATVAGISVNVTTVAGDTAGINYINNNRANLQIIWEDLEVGGDQHLVTIGTDMAAGGNQYINTLGANYSVLSNLNTNFSVYSAVNGNSANINTVAGIAANVTSVAGNETNINTVAGISGDVTGVAANETNINAVANAVTTLQPRRVMARQSNGSGAVEQVNVSDFRELISVNGSANMRGLLNSIVSSETVVGVDKPPGGSPTEAIQYGWAGPVEFTGSSTYNMTEFYGKLASNATELVRTITSRSASETGVINIGVTDTLVSEERFPKDMLDGIETFGWHLIPLLQEFTPSDSLRYMVQWEAFQADGSRAQISAAYYSATGEFGYYNTSTQWLATNPATLTPAIRFSTVNYGNWQAKITEANNAATTAQSNAVSHANTKFSEEQTRAEAKEALLESTADTVREARFRELLTNARMSDVVWVQDQNQASEIGPSTFTGFAMIVKEPSAGTINAIQFNCKAHADLAFFKVNVFRRAINETGDPYGAWDTSLLVDDDELYLPVGAIENATSFNTKTLFPPKSAAVGPGYWYVVTVEGYQADKTTPAQITSYNVAGASGTGGFYRNGSNWLTFAQGQMPGMSVGVVPLTLVGQLESIDDSGWRIEVKETATVKKSGGNYSTLGSAFTARGAGRSYRERQEYEISSGVYSENYLFVPKNSIVLGRGRVTIDGTQADSTPTADIAAHSTLELDQTAFVTGLYVIAENQRYGIHIETGASAERAQIHLVKVNGEHRGNAGAVAHHGSGVWTPTYFAGIGTHSDQEIIIEACEWRSSVVALYAHTNVNFERPSNIRVIGGAMINSDGHTAVLIDENASGQVHQVTFDGTHIGGVINIGGIPSLSANLEDCIGDLVGNIQMTLTGCNPVAVFVDNQVDVLRLYSKNGVTGEITVSGTASEVLLGRNPVSRGGTSGFVPTRPILDSDHAVDMTGTTVTGMTLAERLGDLTSSSLSLTITWEDATQEVITLNQDFSSMTTLQVATALTALISDPDRGFSIEDPYSNQQSMVRQAQYEVVVKNSHSDWPILPGSLVARDATGQLYNARMAVRQDTADRIIGIAIDHIMPGKTGRVLTKGGLIAADNCYFSAAQTFAVGTEYGVTASYIGSMAVDPSTPGHTFIPAVRCVKTSAGQDVLEIL